MNAVAKCPNSNPIYHRLLATTETQHQMQGALLLNVVVRECTAVFQLLTREDKSLLVRGDALLVLDLALHIVNGVRGLDF